MLLINAKSYSKQTLMEHVAIFSIIVPMTFQEASDRKKVVCQTNILDCRIPFGFADAVGCIPIVTDSPD